MQPRKRFGQNFLHDQNVIQKIIQAVNPRPNDHLLEIGPGRGALTQDLVNSGANLTLVEIDRDLAQNLRLRFDITILEQDILAFDLTDLPSPLKIVGNLPYNISTPLLFHLFAHLTMIEDMTFMLQQEVVNRMVASPGGKEYGRLSVMCQYHCEIEKMFTVAPGSFTPAPKVQSAVVKLWPRKSSIQTNTELLNGILQDAFSRRRKTLRNALGNHLNETELESLGIDPGLRPQNLSVAQYVACANLVANRE